jgi:hypothetical protein
MGSNAHRMVTIVTMLFRNHAKKVNLKQSKCCDSYCKLFQRDCCIIIGVCKRCLFPRPNGALRRCHAATRDNPLTVQDCVDRRGEGPGAGNLRGGTVGFNALLTCGGPFKHEHSSSNIEIGSLGPAADSQLARQHVSGTLELDSTADRTRSVLAALARYDATIGMVLSHFFLNPKLEVRINQRTPQHQTLTVKARRASIKGLMPQLWVGGDGPYVLYWMPLPTVKHIDLIPEEEHELLIWYESRRTASGEGEIILNCDPVVRFESGHLRESYTDMAIRFIADNYADKPRQFRLNTKSWDEFNLTERH